MKNILILLVFLFLLPFRGQSQHVYHLSYQLDIPAGSLVLGTLTASYVLSKKNHAPALSELALLDKNHIWKIDRSATNRWSRTSATASDAVMYASIAMPGLLFINKQVRQERYISLIYLETMLLTAGVTSLVKEVTRRYRPYVYNVNVPDEKRTEKDAARSFFSGHTSLTASASFFMASIYSDLIPHCRFKPLVWTSAAVLPAAAGLLRYFAGKHYPTDIIAGYAVGGAIGFFVPYLHKKIGSKQ